MVLEIVFAGSYMYTYLCTVFVQGTPKKLLPPPYGLLLITLQLVFINPGFPKPVYPGNPAVFQT